MVCVSQAVVATVVVAVVVVKVVVDGGCVAVELFTGGNSGTSVGIGLTVVGAGVVGLAPFVTTFHIQVSYINFQF